LVESGGPEQLDAPMDTSEERILRLDGRSEPLRTNPAPKVVGVHAAVIEMWFEKLFIELLQGPVQKVDGVPSTNVPAATERDKKVLPWK